MKEKYGRTGSPKWLFLILGVIVLAAVVVTVLCLWPKEAQQPPQEPTAPPDTQPQPEATQETTEASIPFQTEYILLSYPAEMGQTVSVTYEALPDGQQVIFTTDHTGQELELFRFSISASGTDGYRLGVLNDPQAGALSVCVDVKSYQSGSWTPEQYEKLNQLQERVNDIIIQFYEDPRFVPDRP